MPHPPRHLILLRQPAVFLSKLGTPKLLAPGLPSPVPGPSSDPPSPAAPYVYTPEEEAILFPKLDPNPPDPDKPLNPFTHPGDYWFAVAHGYRRDNPPKHIPDRRWEEDFGNPRRFKG